MATMEAILHALEDHLTPIVEASQGKVYALQDPAEVESKLGETPAGAWSLLMCWEGYAPFEDDPIPNSGLEWTNFVFIIETNRGMPMKRGKDLPHFSALVEQVIQWLRAIQLTDSAGNSAVHGMEFRGSAWLGSEKETFRRHRVVFRVPYALTAPEPVQVAIQ